MELMKTYLQYIKESSRYDLTPENKEDISLVNKLFEKILNNIDNIKIEYLFKPECPSIILVPINDKSSKPYDLFMAFRDNFIYLETLDPQRILRDSTATNTSWGVVHKIDVPEIEDMICKTIAKAMDNDLNKDFIGENGLIIGNDYSRVKDIMKKIVNNSYAAQKHLIEKGELVKLKEFEILPQILEDFPELKDIKKQTEWS